MLEAPGTPQAVVLDGVWGGVPRRHTSLGQPWEAVCAHVSQDAPWGQNPSCAFPSFPEISNQVLSFTTNSLLPSCLGQAQGRGRGRVCPSLSCATGDEGRFLHPAQRGWVRREGAPGFPVPYNTHLREWRVQVTTEQLQPPPDTSLLPQSSGKMITWWGQKMGQKEEIAGGGRCYLCVPFAWPSVTPLITA